MDIKIINEFFDWCECGDRAKFGDYRIQNLGVKEDTISGKRQCFYVEKSLDAERYKNHGKEW